MRLNKRPTNPQDMMNLKTFSYMAYVGLTRQSQLWFDTTRHVDFTKSVFKSDGYFSFEQKTTPLLSPQKPISVVTHVLTN